MPLFHPKTYDVMLEDFLPVGFVVTNIGGRHLSLYVSDCVFVFIM